MSERIQIPRMVRFEVFKRDKFTCQYCGQKAPDVVLQADHIHPVAEGGRNELMNLVTACIQCNGGKGARLLDDQSVVERQRKQIEELEERRQQLEMMLQWRDEAAKLDDRVHEVIADHIRSMSEYGPNENGMGHIRKWARMFPLEIILRSIDECFDRYLARDAGGKTTTDSWNVAFDKVPAFCRSKVKYGDGPDVDGMAYAQGIMRKRHRARYYSCMPLLKSAVDAGVAIDEIQDAAKHSESTEDFEEAIGFMIAHARTPAR